MITCYQCNKELYETDESEPYQWVLVECNLYCWDCMNDN